MPSSPTEHPAWVQIFEYATQPSTDPAAVRAVSNSGSTRRTITWASSTPTNPSGNTVAIWSSPFALAESGWPSLVTSRRPTAQLVRARSPRGFGPSEPIGPTNPTTRLASDPANSATSKPRLPTVCFVISTSSWKSSRSAAVVRSGSRCCTTSSSKSRNFAHDTSPNPMPPRHRASPMPSRLSVLPDQ